MLQMVMLLLLACIAFEEARSYLVHHARLLHNRPFNGQKLAMSAKTLASVQSRLSGREDLPCMFEDDGSDEDILTMEDLELAGMSAEQPPAVGQQLTGYVIDVDDNGALLAIGGKKSGFIPLTEASLMPPRHMSDVVKVGDTVTAEMIGTLRGMPVMSLRSAQLVDAWKCVAKVRAADESFAVQVAEVNRGGAVCNAFGGLKAFLPGSHYLGTPDESIVGSSITVKILDAAEEEGKLVVSQRLALSAASPALPRGTLVSGTVTGLRPYGVFLELEGGHSGLLHISQISADRIENLAAHFAAGDKLKVVVLDHDRASGRVALSTKPLELTAGDMLRDKAGVFAQAEETLRRYHERVDTEKAERAAALQAAMANLAPAGSDCNDAEIGGGSNDACPVHVQSPGESEGASAASDSRTDSAEVHAGSGRMSRKPRKPRTSASLTDASRQGECAVTAAEDAVAKKPRSTSRALEGGETGAVSDASSGATEAVAPTRKRRAPVADAGKPTVAKNARHGSPPPSIDAILASIIADTAPPAQP